MSDFHHRSTLTQKNKPFKSKHATKGAIKRAAGGRVESVRDSGKNAALKSREDRRNLANQNRKNKIQRQIQKKRALSTGEAPPRVVGVVLLGEVPNIEEHLLNLKKEGEANYDQEKLESSNFTLYSNKWKVRLSFHYAGREINSYLDLGKVAEVLLCVVPNSGIDEKGAMMLRLLQAQGFGSIVLSIDSSSSAEFKKMKKSLIEKYFPDLVKSIKVLQSNNSSELIRSISQIGCEAAPVSRHIPRSFLISETKPQIKEEENGQNTLIVKGYIRGGNLSANQLVHIPGYGDFRLRGIFDEEDICIAKHNRSNQSMETSSSPGEALQLPDEQGETLITENPLDPLEGEQNIDIDDEDDILNDGQSSKRKIKTAKASNNYQACWIVDSDDEEEAENGDNNFDTNTSEGAEVAMLSDDEVENNHMNDEDDDEEDLASVEEELLRKRQQEEDMLYPDEVDTPDDIPARDRYQKYRGLKSFRSSPWDAKENLPRDYAKIFQFKNFKRTFNRVLQQIDESGISFGKFVTIQVANVPRNILQHDFVSHPLILFALFPYEQKTSVVNFTIQRNNDFEGTIQSKEELIFHCGFRRFKVNPIFSEHTQKIDKHKYERFLQPSCTSVATIYGPITVPPSPLLVFRLNSSNDLEYIAKGGLLSVDPDRLVIKKITLSGHPFRITKKKSVVRKMFYNAEDVNWFKPVELRTKHGRTGHILCSVGTHGYMKCQFDQPLQPNDTILMNLYKRVYPQWKAEYC